MERHRNPFTCYFCHEKIENETEMGHTSVCGNVLVPCPNKCGSYVPRMEMSLHKKECLNRASRSMTRHTTTTETYEDASRISNSSIKELQHDFHKLSTRLANYEVASRPSQDLDKLKYQTQLLFEWKKAADFKLDTLTQSINSLEKSRNESEYHWMSLQKNLMNFDKLQMDINQATESFLKEQNYNRQANLEFAKNLDELKDFFEQENATFSGLWADQKRSISHIQDDISFLKQHFEEMKTKHVSVVFDIKTISQIASETAEKFEIQDREFAKFRQQFDQMKLDLEILENLASNVDRSSPGHLIWKITDFEAKMSKSRDSNTVIKSPIFHTHNFGYKIRVLVYLNGLKKWKDRYSLISIHVLKGDFDALLKWPCHIEGTVTLRDQENGAKNFNKHIVAKRQTGDEENEEPQESSFSYIFIPHATLTKAHHLKNDEIYLEVKIEQNTKLLTETTL
ncbi:TNF receptor-associated factor 3 [Tribolium madens]|uniref:TNF receptor-associated factor 3 n=1 Tax=Tribolium madens TaxID=41895 RepID=UPI001CF74F4F|nr:TNF receptor-associated factor 3 [Tribolium madens]